MKKESIPTNEAEPPQPGNAFMAMLQELREGQVLSEASQKLSELVQAVELHGKAGSITIKLTVAVAGRGNAIAVGDVITLKKPEPDQEPTLLYATEDGTLQRENPNQRSFELREVRGGQAEEKDLEAEKLKAKG